MVALNSAMRLVNHYVTQIPIDPAEVASCLGIDVRANPNLGDASGCAYIDKESGKKVIEFNPNEPEVRQRFTIAHELGHHELSHTQNNKQWRDTASNFRTGSSVCERDANAFAAELLVPSRLLEILVIDKQVKDLDMLAKAFNVSGAVIGYRLKDMGLAE